MAGGIREPLLTCSSSFCKKVDKYTKPAEFKFAKTVPTLNRYTSRHKDLCETMNMCDFVCESRSCANMSLLWPVYTIR